MLIGVIQETTSRGERFQGLDASVGLLHLNLGLIVICYTLLEISKGLSLCQILVSRLPIVKRIFRLLFGKLFFL